MPGGVHGAHAGETPTVHGCGLPALQGTLPHLHDVVLKVRGAGVGAAQPGWVVVGVGREGVFLPEIQTSCQPRHPPHHTKAGLPCTHPASPELAHHLSLA